METLNDCKVISVRQTDGNGNLKAFADIRIGGALIIRGCYVFSGKNGLFAKLPQQLSRDGRWYDVVFAADDALKEHYSETIIKAYEAESKTE